MWKTVKLLILSNFNFFHNVFLKLFFLQCVKMSIYGEKGLIFLLLYNSIDFLFSLAKNTVPLQIEKKKKTVMAKNENMDSVDRRSDCTFCAI